MATASFKLKTSRNAIIFIYREIFAVDDVCADGGRCCTLGELLFALSTYFSIRLASVNCHNCCCGSRDKSNEECDKVSRSFDSHFARPIF